MSLGGFASGAGSDDLIFAFLGGSVRTSAVFFAIYRSFLRARDSTDPIVFTGTSVSVLISS